MTEANAIVPADQITALSTQTDDTFKAMAAAIQSFLPRIQLGGGQSDAVKEGKLPIAHWGLFQGENVIDLGAEIDALILAWQPKAMDTNTDPPVSVIKFDDPKFTEIKDKSAVANSGCMWGFEFLLYLPKSETFVTYFMASKTARREAPAIKALIGRAATLKIKFIKNSQYSWHGPVVVPCSTPYDVPPQDEMLEAAKKFSTVTVSNVEKVESTEGERAR